MTKRKIKHSKKSKKQNLQKKIVVVEKDATKKDVAVLTKKVGKKSDVGIVLKSIDKEQKKEEQLEKDNFVQPEKKSEQQKEDGSSEKNLVKKQSVATKTGALHGVTKESLELEKKKASANHQLEKNLVRDRKRLKRKIKKGEKEEARIPLWTKILILVLSLIIILMIAVAVFGYMLLSHTANVFKGNPMDILIGTELAKDENNLTNVLIFGTSEDAEGHGGELLTDSILVASVDQEKRTSKIFSIPRDLWVNYTVPGGDAMNCVVGTQGKINATYMCALNEYKNNKDQASRYFAKKISEITGLNLQYYVSLDWSALKTVVDELGKIDVDVYADDERGIHDSCQRLDLKKGMNYGLNGDIALRLARARNAGCDGGEDYGLSKSNFDREINQQRIFNAIKNKAMSIGILTKPTKVIRLIDSLGNNVKTNITMAEVRTLIDIATNLNGEIESISTIDEFGVGRIGVQSIVLPKGASTYSESSMFNYGDFQRYLRKKLLK